MSTRKVDLKDYARVLKENANMTLKAQRKAVIRGLERSIPDLVANSPVDTGFYAASWFFSADETRAIIGNHAPYAGIIEYGARPFTPPLGPLLAWAKRVLGRGGQHETGQPEGDYTPEVWALAIYTRNKIKKYGMAPRHVFENTMPQIIANIRAELKRAS